MWGSVIQHLLITVGYDAANLVVEATSGVLPPLIVMALCMAVLANGWTDTNQPLQTTLHVIASTCMTKSIMSPFLLGEEPDGFLATPSVLLYFSIASAMICFMVAAHHRLEGIVPYFVAFTTLHGVNHFLSKGHDKLMLYVACIYYLSMPSAADAKHPHWEGHMLSLMDSFACKGVVRALTLKGPIHDAPQGWQRVGIYMLVLMLMEYALRIEYLQARIQFIKDTFGFSLAMELFGILQKTERIRPLEIAFFFLIPLMILHFFEAAAAAAAQQHAQLHLFVLTRVSVIGFGIAAANALKQLIDAIVCPKERVLLYCISFVLFQTLIDLLNAATAAPNKHDATVAALNIADTSAASA